MRPVRKLLRRMFHSVYRPYVFSRTKQPSTTRLHGRTFACDPEVFHPVYFSSTRLLVDALARLDLAGKRFLDMGCGTGAVGVFAAAGGAVVTACDVNPRAVALARQNARTNGVTTEVVASDLFAALPGRGFDVICFNLPFYPREPRTDFERAFFAGPDFAVVRAFAAGCATALVDGDAARVLVVYSEDSGRDLIASIFASAGFAPAAERATFRLFERFHVVFFRRAEPRPRERG